MVPCTKPRAPHTQYLQICRHLRPTGRSTLSPTSKQTVHSDKTSKHIPCGPTFLLASQHGRRARLYRHDRTVDRSAGRPTGRPNVYRLGRSNAETRQAVTSEGRAADRPVDIPTSLLHDYHTIRPSHRPIIRAANTHQQRQSDNAISELHIARHRGATVCWSHTAK